MQREQRKARRVLPDGGQRLKALRQLLDGISPKHAAEVVNLQGFGGQQWTNVEAPNHRAQLDTEQAREIAEALGVPHSFFTAPMHKLGDVTSGIAATPVVVPPDPAIVERERKKAEKRASRTQATSDLADDALDALETANRQPRPDSNPATTRSS